MFSRLEMFEVFTLILLPVLVACSGDGNVHLLEEEVANALRTCLHPNPEGARVRRSDDYNHDNAYTKSPRIDGGAKIEMNQYNHERRNASDMKEQIHVLNATDYDYNGYGTGNAGEKYVNSVPKSAINGNNYNNDSTVTTNRTKRSDPLLDKDDSDQCLSQCVFANLQVVDSRGIPREAEVWNKVQGSVTSQQSRAALRDQIRACFQELQSEAEDNGCSYSNKLERCLMLRFSDRKVDDSKANQKNT